MTNLTKGNLKTWISWMKKRITKLLKTNRFHTTVFGLVRFDIVILFSEVQCFSKPGQQLICPCLFTCSIIRCVVYVTMQISSRNLPYRIKRHTDGIISDCAKKCVIVILIGVFWRSVKILPNANIPFRVNIEIETRTLISLILIKLTIRFTSY